MIKVVFVCLGNICRSPMAEGIFKKLVHEKGLNEQIQIDSAGTSGYHRGSYPDPRMRETAIQHHVKLDSRSRKFTKDDFKKFDYIVGMDDQNIEDIKSMTSNKTPDNYVLIKMREFDNDTSNEDVHDPYYDTMNGFERCYQILNESCNNFLDSLIKKHDL